MFESVNLLLHSFCFVWIQTVKRMNQLNLFNHEEISRFFFHCLIDFTSCATA